MKWALGPRTVHLCVDMQVLFSDEGPWPTPWMKRTLPAIAEIAGRHADATIFTRFIPLVRPEDMPRAWRGYYERWKQVTRESVDPRMLDLVEPLKSLAQEATTIDKPVYSPFHGARLPALLRERDANLLVITGAETDVCVLATVLGAIDHGFPVLLVEDAVCSSSDHGHEALLGLFRGRFSAQVDVAGTEEVLGAWTAGL
jgi:nicotinamidase-related amidase